MKADRPVYITALAGLGMVAAAFGVIALGFGAASPRLLRVGIKPEVSQASILGYYGANALVLAVASWFMFEGKAWTRWVFAVVALGNVKWLHSVATQRGVVGLSIGWALLVLVLLILPDSKAFFVGVKRRYVSERELKRPAVGTQRR